MFYYYTFCYYIMIILIQHIWHCMIYKLLTYHTLVILDSMMYGGQPYIFIT